MFALTRRRLRKTAPAGTGALLLSQGRTAAAERGTPLRATTRLLDVTGRAASVLGLLGLPDRSGLALDRGDGFKLEFRNDLQEPTVSRWRGLTPPFRQDGVPGLTQASIGPRGRPLKLDRTGGGPDYRWSLEWHGRHGNQKAQQVAFDADSRGHWSLHCHHLYHMAAGMMTTLACAGST